MGATHGTQVSWIRLITTTSAYFTYVFYVRIECVKSAYFTYVFYVCNARVLKYKNRRVLRAYQTCVLHDTLRTYYACFTHVMFNWDLHIKLIAAYKSDIGSREERILVAVNV